MAKSSHHYPREWNERVPAVVMACLLPSELRIVLHPGVGLVDGGVPLDIPMDIVPLELRLPDKLLWIRFDENNNVVRVWQREELPIPLDYEPRAEFDTGRFVARYLQVLAWLSIASMIATPIIFKSLYIDLSFIFLFWAAGPLKRHSVKARMWVLTISGLYLAFCAVFLLKVAFFGTAGLTIRFAGRNIQTPPLWLVLLVAVPICAVVSVPLFVLLSARARRQFGAIGGRRQKSPQLG
jgi:hypothetical protein